jgi:hypothetical protein
MPSIISLPLSPESGPRLASSRPVTRADCIDGERPCPWAGECRYGLVDAAESCALDIADGGARTLEQVAQLIGRSRARVDQIEEKALRKLRRRLAMAEKRFERSMREVKRALARVDEIEARTEPR